MQQCVERTIGLVRTLVAVEACALLGGFRARPHVHRTLIAVAVDLRSWRFSIGGPNHGWSSLLQLQQRLPGCGSNTRARCAGADGRGATSTTRERGQARPFADLPHAWLRQERALLPSGSATARAIQYSLGRWVALTRFLGDERLTADNNRVENQNLPLALASWLFAGSLRAGQRASAVMRLVHSARIDGNDPYATCAKCWSGYPHTRQTALASCCHIGGLFRADGIRWRSPCRFRFALIAVNAPTALVSETGT